MDWYLAALKKYAVFSGRARRKEFWLFLVIAWITLGFVGLLEGFVWSYSVLTSIYALALLVPFFAVTTRRLHDNGRSGVFVLLYLVPFIGSLVLIILLVREGDPGANRYGEDPKLTP
ncbi:DUF805 domain-containing protein [Streptomyces sp. NBC_01537]|uniref:DUF805 domain-containing protein n=1 Tax=Streptomyces sp. NBC_01537 TaxID=2903896 RepID=UPI00386D97BC